MDIMVKDWQAVFKVERLAAYGGDADAGMVIGTNDGLGTGGSAVLASVAWTPGVISASCKPAPQQVSVDAVGHRHRRDRDARLQADRHGTGFELVAVPTPPPPPTTVRLDIGDSVHVSI